MTVHEHVAITPAIEKAETRKALAALLFGAAALLLALVALVFLLWLMLSSPKATPFDSDGVRCYRAATELACIQTARP
jgi:hypothetical protein